MVCHQTGWEGHPDLAIDPTERLTPTRPEYATEQQEPVEDRVEVEAEKQWENLTRKQKRAIMFGSKEQSLVSPPADACPADPVVAAGSAVAADPAASFSNFVAPFLDPGVAADIAARLDGDLSA